MFRVANFLVKVTDDPAMFVTSAMLAQDDVFRRSRGDTVELSSQVTVQEKPCAYLGTFIASAKCTPKWCSKRCGGTKARFLMEARKRLGREMEISYLL